MLPVWQLAFRPLFLAGTIFSLLAIAWWAYFWWSPFLWQPYGNPVWWHGHEMLFGFVAAIVLGFLLTAIQNWTGVPGISGWPLIALFLSWLLGRLLIAFGAGLPEVIVMIGDSLFLLGGLIAVARPIFMVRQWRNLVFVPVLLLLLIFNLISHRALLLDKPLQATAALHGAIMLFTLVVTIIGGRVIPFFTANRLGLKKPEIKLWLELVCIGSIVIMVAMAVLGFQNVPALLMAVFCILAALAHGWRFCLWQFWRCWQIPLLWSLHLSYLFIPLGLLMLALSSVGYLDSRSAGLHCFTVGAMGSMILAMISRVTLGHTGRPLQPPRAMTLAFVLILVAAIIRVVVPGWLPQWGQWGFALASVAWLISYGLFVFFYGPMLYSVRADGRPG